jgi:hypothetical protein
MDDAWHPLSLRTVRSSSVVAKDQNTDKERWECTTYSPHVPENMLAPLPKTTPVEFDLCAWREIAFVF